jgi:hypothetical protein
MKLVVEDYLYENQARRVFYERRSGFMYIEKYYGDAIYYVPLMFSLLGYNIK